MKRAPKVYADTSVLGMVRTGKVFESSEYGGRLTRIGTTNVSAGGGECRNIISKVIRAQQNCTWV